MEIALIGLLGVIIGLFANEYFRRKGRIESYSSQIFNKRIKLYEILYNKVCNCSSIFADIFITDKHPMEKREEIVSEAIFDIAKFCDKNSFYIDERITLQSMSILIGVEGINDIQDQKDKEKEIKLAWKNLRDTKKMIRKESGISELDKLFQSITRAKHKSPIISYYNELKIKQKKEEKILQE